MGDSGEGALTGDGTDMGDGGVNGEGADTGDGAEYAVCALTGEGMEVADGAETADATDATDGAEAVETVVGADTVEMVEGADRADRAEKADTTETVVTDDIADIEPGFTATPRLTSSSALTMWAWLAALTCSPREVVVSAAAMPAAVVSTMTPRVPVAIQLDFMCLVPFGFDVFSQPSGSDATRRTG